MYAMTVLLDRDVCWKKIFLINMESPRKIPEETIMSIVTHVLGMTGAVVLIFFGTILCEAADFTPAMVAEIFSAASSDVNRVRELIDAGIPVNIEDKDGVTPLMIAVQNGKLEIVELLLQRQADTKILNQGWGGTNALIMAATLGRADMVKMLLQWGADPNGIGRYKQLPLASACQYGHLDIVNVLLDNGAQLNPKDGHEPLVMAAMSGRPEIIKVLLDRGANLNFSNSGYTPLMAAAGTCRSEIVRILLERGASPDVKDKYGTAMTEAMKCTHSNDQAHKTEGAKIVSLLSDRGAALNLPALASTGDIKKLNQALSVSPPPTRGQLNQAMMAASGAGHPAVVSVLLEHGADVKYSTPDGTTCLMVAAYSDQIETMRVLLAKGADPNTQSQSYSGPLWIAALKGQIQMGRMLLEHGAEVNQKGKGGTTPLLACLASPFAKEGEGNLEFVNLLLKSGAAPDLAGEDNGAPLMVAAANGDVSVINLLLEYRARIDTTDNEGKTPLWWAASRGKLDAVKILLSKGADPNFKNRDGKTALNAASSAGHKNVVEFLSEHGATE